MHKKLYLKKWNKSIKYRCMIKKLKNNYKL